MHWFSDNSLILHSSPSGQPSLTPTPRLHLDPNRSSLGGNKAAHQGVKNTPTPWDKDYTAWGSDQNSREHGLYRPGGFRNSLPASPLSLSLSLSGSLLGLVGISEHETGMTGTSVVWPLFHLWNAPPTPQTASCL